MLDLGPTASLLLVLVGLALCLDAAPYLRQHVLQPGCHGAHGGPLVGVLEPAGTDESDDLWGDGGGMGDNLRGARRGTGALPEGHRRRMTGGAQRDEHSVLKVREAGPFPLTPPPPLTPWHPHLVPLLQRRL